MAEYYCDQGLYTYAATPTWLTAQEGDGKNGSGASLTAVLTGNAVTSVTVGAGGTRYSPNTRVYFSGGGGSGAVATLNVDGAGTITSVTVSNGGSGYTSAPTVSLVPGAAVPAVGSVSFSGVPTAGTISICGASVSTTGVIGAASADAAANALASNINATTATVSSSVSASTPQLRDFVYARGPSGGAPAGTCQIMTRAGSYDCNTDINSNCDVVEALDNCTRVAFGDTGNGMQRGRSGAWGWLFNDQVLGTIWPSAKAAWAYGIAMSGSGAGPLMGTTAANDVVHVRGGGRQVAGSSTNAASLAPSREDVNFLFDNGTVWVGDSGGFTVKYGISGSQSFTFQPAASQVWSGRVRGALRFLHDTGTGSLTLNLPNASGKRFILDGVEFDDTNGQILLRPGIGGNPCHGAVTNFKFTFRRNTFYSVFGTVFSVTNGSFEMDNGEFEWTAFTGTPTALFALGNPTTAGSTLRVGNIKAIGLSNVPLVGVTSLTSAFQLRATFENCDNFVLPASILGLTGINGGSVYSPHDGPFVAMSNVGPTKAMRYECNPYMLEWVPGQGFPTYNSQLEDGTAFSYRVRWVTGVNALRYVDPVYLFSFTKTVVTSGKNAVRAHLCLDDAYDHLVTAGHIGIEVAYTDATDSKLRVAKSWPALSACPLETAALSASGASWALGSYTTHVARKIECLLPTNIKQNTSIDVRVYLLQAAPSANQDVFLNHEMDVYTA